jgi:ribonuclease HI
LEPLLTNKELGLVVYPDGGAVPNPGAAGYGIHGYFYELTEDRAETKPVLIPNPMILSNTNQVFNVIPTTNGYVTAEKVVELQKKKACVTPVAYVDLADHFDSIETNNVAELTALLKIFELAESYGGVKSLCIMPDSKYVMDTMTAFIKGWKRNNWLKADGTSPKNLVLIQQLDIHQESLRNRGCDIQYHWVKGHNGDLGNGMADYFASIAVRVAAEHFRLQKGAGPRDPVLTKISPANKQYWGNEVERHPFLNFKRFYFNRVANMNHPGHYFMIEPSGPDMMIGKRANEAYAVVRLNTPDPSLEAVIQAQGRFGQHENRVILALADRVYNRFVNKFVDWFSSYAFHPSANHREVVFQDLRPVALEHNPPLLIYRSTEILLHLDNVLDKFLVQTGKADTVDEDVIDNEYANLSIVKDVTDEFYTVEEKGSGKNRVLKKILKTEFKVGIKTHTPKFEVKLPDGLVLNIKVPITFGMDLPNRNQLKRLEAENPNIYLVMWKDSDVSYRYAFVIDCISGVGIWSNYFCDRILLPVM